MTQPTTHQAEDKGAEMRFLLVDADDGYVARLREMITACCPKDTHVDQASTASEALSLINEHYYDLCFLDHLLDDDSTGMDVLKSLSGTTALTAFVVLTSGASKALAFEALSLGAMDYLIKDRFTEFEMAKCVSYSVYRKRKEVSLQKESLKDSLTGLGNKGLFDAQLNQAVQRAKRDGENLGLLVIDIDNFKNINDKYGHKDGDLLLQQIAERIVKYTRASDVVARIGGDEFAAILIKPKSTDDVYDVAEKIEKAISSTPYKLNGKMVKVTASIGSSNLPDDAKDVDSLFRFADMRMYKSKNLKKTAMKQSRDYLDIVLR